MNKYYVLVGDGQIIKAQPGHYLQVIQIPIPVEVPFKPELLDKGINDMRDRNRAA